MNNLIILLLLILIVIFVLSISNNNIQCCTKNQTKNIQNNYEPFQNSIKSNKKKYIYLFYSNECKHSINFIPIWETLKTLKDHTNIVEFRDIEASNDINDEFIKYNIKQMPTILIQNKDERDFTVYKGSRTLEDIVAFLKLKTGINLNRNDLEGFSNFSFNNITKEYKVESPHFFQKIKGDVQYTHPLFSLIVSFLHLNKSSKEAPLEEVIDLLNLKENKDFLKCNEKGICGEIETLKNIYETNDKMLKIINLIEDIVCSKEATIIME